MNNPTLEEIQRLQEQYQSYIEDKTITVSAITTVLGFTRPAWYNWRNGKYQMSWVHYALLEAMLEYLKKASDRELEELRTKKKAFSFRTIAFTI